MNSLAETHGDNAIFLLVNVRTVADAKKHLGGRLFGGMQVRRAPEYQDYDR